MLRLYVGLKEERPDAILLMRVGDFFEAYGEDAETIARELSITLTGRDVQGMAERYPMAGVPFHALDRYLARLVRKGFKVAICDQIENPKEAKGLVKRAVTRVVTPGTLVEDSLLDAKSNNFLTAVVKAQHCLENGADGGYGVCAPRLAPLVTARRLARQMQRVIRQNFAWAIAYNLVAVPLAITGHIAPAWAAIGMALSSLAVVANSLRLNGRLGFGWKS